MAAGLSDHVCRLEEIVLMADSYLPKPDHAALTKEFQTEALSVVRSVEDLISMQSLWLLDPL